MKIEKDKKFVANSHDKTEYIIHIWYLKQALKKGLVLNKGHRAIKFIQSTWLKPYIDMNTDLRKKKQKTMENLIKHRDIKLVTAERRRDYLVSKPNYHTTKFFTERFFINRSEKTETLMSKPVYLGFSVLELSNI